MSGALGDRQTEGPRRTLGSRSPPAPRWAKGGAKTRADEASPLCPQTNRRALERRERPSGKEGFLTLPCLSSICAGAAPSEEPDVETPSPGLHGPSGVSGPTTTSCLWLQLKAPGVRRIKRSHTPPCSQTPPDRDDLGSNGKDPPRQDVGSSLVLSGGPGARPARGPRQSWVG